MIFFFNDTATTEIYTLSLHDALPILQYLCDASLSHSAIANHRSEVQEALAAIPETDLLRRDQYLEDRKSTRLNSSHANISYAVFCLKKKNITTDCQITVVSNSRARLR